MLFLQPPQLLSFVFTLLSVHTAHARPKLSEEVRELLESRYHYLDKRQCANPCGWSGQVCCGTSQTCSTNSLGQAVCLNGGSTPGNVALADTPGVETYVTTIIQSGLLTKTTTYTRSFGAQQTSAAASQQAAISCSLAMGEKPCGSICCATGQYCVYAGQCGASADQAGESSSSVLGQVFTPTATNTAPLRPTSNAAVTITTRGSVTTTVAFTSPTAASATAASGAAGVTSTNNGLSGGAIAGIVIGVLLGIILLIALIFCCCAATVGNAILAALGCGKRRKKKTEVTYIEEHGHHHSGGSVSKPPRRWYGILPPRNEAPKKKKSGIGGFTAVAGGLGALAVILGLKRKSDKKKTEYSGSSYYSSEYSYYDSSESSGDRYTRRSGRSASRR